MRAYEEAHAGQVPRGEPTPEDIGPTGRGQMNMGTGFGGGGGRGGRGGSRGGNGAAPPPGVNPAAVAASGGPEGRGNVLIAWDPIAQKERWRAAGGAAGFNQGGTLATAGNLVFSSVNTRLIAYRADTGEQVLDVATGLSQMGPPMTFQLDGKQYVAVAGGPPQAAGGRGGRGAAPAPGAASATPPQPSRMMVYMLDGKAAPPPAPQVVIIN